MRNQKLRATDFGRTKPKWLMLSKGAELSARADRAVLDLSERTKHGSNPRQNEANFSQFPQ
jgi:hypothetical protein